MSNSENTIKVLKIEPGKKPETVEIKDTLEDLQKAVGGYIQITYPFKERIGLVCNEEGKLVGLPLNRAIYSKDKEIIDIIAGTFLICSAPADSENLCSLPETLIKKYSKIFKYPEYFYRGLDGSIKVKSYKL